MGSQAACPDGMAEAPRNPIRRLAHLEIANEVLDALPVQRFRIRGDQVNSLGVTWQLGRLDWSEIHADPELEAAIVEGAATAEAGEALDDLPAVHEIPHRLDPHNFILPGELPPLESMLDRFVDGGGALAHLLAVSPISLEKLIADVHARHSADDAESGDDPAESDTSLR